MRLALIYLMFASVPFSLNAQTTLYQNKSFSVSNESVIQDNYSATARSRTHLVSNYKAIEKSTHHRDVIFKFSINGQDNEQGYGIDHKITIYPENGKYVSPVLVFGKPDQSIAGQPPVKGDFLEKNVQVTFRVDMNHLLSAWKKKGGQYELFNGQKLSAKDFKGLYIAGGTAPLTWDFASLTSRPEFELTDPDKDGIYEVTIPFNTEAHTGQAEGTFAEWTLQKDISHFPQYESDHVLADALYNLSLEEMMKNVRPDSAFMAGAKWEGVWTRDISYSILLSLAAIYPEASKHSLMKKVKNGVIIQDTGTGGSWPVSSDRTTWALAAWEIYLVTGDKEWLKKAYQIVKKTAEADLQNVHDKETGLFFGESSFMDWREQSYPRWMEPADIYKSRSLSTNAVHYQTYRILAQMAGAFAEGASDYNKIADDIKKGINSHLWLENLRYYGQYLYGRNYASVSPRTDALGSALCVLFDVTDKTMASDVIQNTPLVDFGTPCIYPQIPGIPPYHNDAIWPFVEAYWTWAAVKAENPAAVEHGIASVYRQGALFLTNKENMVASTGDFAGTEINSDRQLWSVAGNLAMVCRVFFGMHFKPDRLAFAPYVPPSYTGTKTLKNFKYRNTVLEITINGYGSKISEMTLDGKRIKTPEILATTTGSHKLVITLEGDIINLKKENLVANHYAPETPVVQLEGKRLKWTAIKGASKYIIYYNGNKLSETKDTGFAPPAAAGYAEYQVTAMDEAKYESFLSAPVVVPANEIIIDVGTLGLETEKNTVSPYAGLLPIGKTKNQQVPFQVNIVQAGKYAIDFRYTNINGPINTDNKCAIRTLMLAGKPIGTVVLPQRGENTTNRGYTNSIVVELPAGMNNLSLIFREINANMNGEVNEAMIEHIRLRAVK